MREADLPSPGIGSKSMHLRRVAANVLSSVAIAADQSATGASSEATKLAAFFTDCAAAATEQTKLRVAMTLATTGGVNTLAVGATNQLIAGKGASTGAVTYVSSDPTVATVTASGGLVTGVMAGDVVITAKLAATATHRANSRTVGIKIV